MAKEKPAADAEEKRLKKEKKEQKKRSETDGVRKPSSASSTKKEKSDKKAKKHKDPSSKTKTDKGETRNGEANGGGGIKKEEEQTAAAAADADDMMMTTQLLNTLEAEKPGSVVVKEQDGDVDVKVKTVLRGALVPFANPLADEKVGRKVLKGVKRAAKHKTLKRGVKEVVKALRKSPPSASSTSSALPPAVVVLAADISPMDVISHLPVLCEDHAVPYVFVTSRAELGAAGATKRPTSVVMVGRDVPKGKKGEEGGKKGEEGGKKGEEGEGWEEVYGELVKVVVKAGRGVRI